MTPKTILFDLDGTLTDSGEGIINCAALALQHFGIPVPDRETMRVFVGPPLHDSFIRFGVPEDKAEEAIHIYRSRYIPIGKFENTPYPGIADLLQKLKEQGHRLYVATSKPEQMSIEILEHFDLAKYFTLICGASLDLSRNSKDAVIAYLLQQTETDGEIVMVGDTAFDVLGAKMHGIPTIGVSWGYGKVEDMENAGAAAIVHTMDELYNALNR
jgi:phosphoglycolate phosphatase